MRTIDLFIFILLAERGLAQTLCFVDNTEPCPKENLDDNGVNFIYPGGDTRCGFNMVDGEENPYNFQFQKVRVFPGNQQNHPINFCNTVTIDNSLSVSITGSKWQRGPCPHSLCGWRCLL